MAAYYADHAAPAAWTPPAGVISVAVDVSTGERATDACPPENVKEEWYLAGTEPVNFCELHQPGPGGWLRRQLRSFGDLLGGSAEPERDSVPQPYDF
jgi:hypothetical protein